jgi:hypothetical protein
MTVLGIVAILGIGYALAILVSDQTFSRHPEHPIPGPLTRLNDPYYAHEYEARVQIMYERLAMLREAIGAERAYMFVYTSGDLPPGHAMISNVFEVVRQGVTPQHQHLQGLALPIRQLIDDVGYETYDVLPYIYGRALYNARNRMIGYFAIDHQQSFFLLQDTQIELVRHTMRDLEAVLSQPFESLKEM